MVHDADNARAAFSLKQRIGLFLGPAIFIIIYFFSSPSGMSDPARGIMAVVLWMAVWWISEAIPIAVTALLPIVFFPLTGGLGIQVTTAAYGHPLIFLFVGGFIIAIAIERWNLHKRIAINVISIMGTGSKRIILGFMIATAFLSMWISNTATTLMMMPIGIAVILQLSASYRSTDERHNPQVTVFAKALMLSIAYAASIGGLATLIGTPPNVVFSGMIRQLYDIDISFMTWMQFGLPVSMVLLAVCWYYLVYIAFPLSDHAMPGGQAAIAEELGLLGKMSVEEKRVLAVFLLVALSWVTRSYVLARFIPGINDTVIAVGGAVLLFLIPSRSLPGKMLLEWEDAVRLPWGIVLLFGGGFAMAAGFKDSGLAEWIGHQLHQLEGVHILVLLTLLIAVVNFLTELTSNVSTTTIILPILAALAAAIDVHPFMLMVAAAMAASCAFMLPVATPPNAIIFGSTYVEMRDMVRTGLWLNILSIILLTLFVYFLLPYIWGIDTRPFPASFPR